MQIGTFCRLSARLVAVTMISPGWGTSAAARWDAAVSVCCASTGAAASREEEPNNTGITARNAFREGDVTTNDI